MNFRQLRHLVFLARCGSFGIAAEKLHVTQPALSKSIRTLEQSMGVRLLDRGPTGVTLTEYGKRLIDYGELMLSLSDEAKSEIDAMRGARRGHLRIGAMATFMREILPQTARRFISKYPAVDLSLNEELSPALLSLLLNGAIDLAILTRPRDFPDEDVEYRELLSFPMVLVADRASPLARLQSVTLADLTGYDWILPAMPDPDRLALNALFAAAQLPLPRAICETTSSTYQVSMMRDSPWLSYVTQLSRHLTGPDAPLVAIKLDRPTWTRGIGVAFRRRSVERPVVAGFVRELEHVCRHLEPAINTDQPGTAKDRPE